MTPVTLTDQAILALSDACIAMATLKAAGMWDPDTREPELGWRRTGDLLRAQLPEPDEDRTGDGQVQSGPGFVVLNVHAIDPTTFDSDALAQVAPSQARQIGRALYHQADRAEALNRCHRSTP